MTDAEMRTNNDHTGAKDRNDALETARRLAELALKQQGKKPTEAGVAQTLSAQGQRQQGADVLHDDHR